MKEWRDDALMAVVAAVSLMAIGALAASSVIDNEPGRGWLYDFQTLVTGFLAIAAAGIAVAATRWQDQRQQARHDEVQALNLRMDRLRARRAAFPYAKMLETKASFVLAKAYSATEAWAADDYPRFRQELRELLTAKSDIAETVSGESIVNAKDMFGSDMSFTYKSLMDTLDADAGMAITSAVNYANFGGDDAPNHFVAAHTATVIEKARRAALGSIEFAGQLRILASHYDKIPGAQLFT